jgi:predicted phosphoribosyltransferase
MFYDRHEAGKALAEKLYKYIGTDCVVYAIPRGGVVLGVEIANQIKCPLDVVLVRKVGHPSNPEYAVCAVSKKGMICNEEEMRTIDRNWFDREVKKEREEIERRERVYFEGKGRIDTEGKVAILVDDGIATGSTYLMAVQELKKRRPKMIVAVIPVMPADFENKLKGVVDEIVCLSVDKNYLGSVGSYYEIFPQVTDDEVVKMLKSLP